MKRYFTLFLLGLQASGLLALPVDEATALQVAQAFVARTTQAAQLEVTYRAKGSSASESAYFYVFNTTDVPGFVIVAGDDQALPILGYSEQSVFTLQGAPPALTKWLEGYRQQIQALRADPQPTPAAVADAWAHWLATDVGAPAIESGPQNVNPLLTTTWNQEPHYNALAPFDAPSGQRTVAGCVATAMAQIMKFWNYPANGTGFHSYNHPKYGTLSANFGSTTYQWSQMPNQVNSPNNAVATLMHHCAISVDMNFDIPANGGSGAYVISAASPVTHCSEYALKTYFGYRPTLQGVLRANYSDTQWLNLLRGELDAGRPILYAGFGSGGGHAFVCDGYTTNNFFHFNWGWGGNSDGYFTVNALNPGSLGAGGGTGGFNSGQQVVIGIQPPTTTQSFDLRLNNTVSFSASPLGYGQPLTVTTNIANYGSNNFAGDYAAAVFDNNLTFVDFVQVRTGFSLEAGFTYQNNLTFGNQGSFAMLPGAYFVGIFYRPTGGNWVLVGDQGGFTNLRPLTVVNSSNIELNSAMSVTPGSTLTQGQAMSVNLNLRNDGNSTFTGQYGLGLYNLDGSLAQSIGVINENQGLPAGFTYIAPFLTFSTPSVTVSPGSYLLAVQHRPTGGDWQLSGSSYHQNPVRVTVQTAALAADQYEPNNVRSQATPLALTFSGNTATRNTEGANLHMGSDYDIYQLALAPGFQYVVNARLHDSYNSGNGNTYTVDGLFSYALNDGEWSETYDDVMPGPITATGGNALNFFVAPYFTGETGTYRLDLNITRSPVSSLAARDVPELIRVYPNPTRDRLTFDLHDFPAALHAASLVDARGQQVRNVPVVVGQRTYRLDLSQLASGAYWLRLQTEKGVITRPVVLHR